MPITGLSPRAGENLLPICYRADQAPVIILKIQSINGSLMAAWLKYAEIFC
jgi:hypothetical protein